MSIEKRSEAANTPAWRQRLAEILRVVAARREAAGQEPRSPDLLELFATPGLSGQTLGEIGVQLLRPSESQLLNGPEFFDRPLIHAILRRSYVCRLPWEEAIVQARRRLLATLHGGSPLTEPLRRVLASFAFQAVNNEYVVPPTPEETLQLRALAGRLQEQSRPDVTARDQLMGIAAFAPPTTFGVWSLWRERAPDADREFQVLTERLEDESLRTAPTALPPDDLDERVRHHYDLGPYPRWFDLTVPVRHRIGEATEVNVRALAARTTERPLRVLVAGCGTGQHSLRLALQFTDVDVSAIDVSAESLRYAERQGRNYDARIRYIHGDLRNPPRGLGRFHLIEAVGVLHHLTEPEVGLRSLLTLLEPGGLLKIGLYSRRGRAQLAGIRSFVINSRMSPQATRKSLIQLRPEGLERALIFRDFYCTSGFMDLLGHPVEHLFTPLEIDDLLRRHRLQSLGLTAVPSQAAASYAEDSRADPDMRDLASIDRFDQRNPIVPSMFTLWASSLDGR